MRSGDAEDQWVWALRILQYELTARSRSSEEAKPLLESPLPPKYRTSEAEVRRLLALGVVRSDQTTAGLLEEARKLAAAHQPHLLFAAHLSLARVSEDPHPHLRRALELARRERNRLNIGLATAAAARRYTKEERYAEAIEPGHEALALFTDPDIGASGRAATVAGNLGWTYAELGEWETARDLFAQADAAAQRAGNEAERVTWINQLGNIEFERREYAAAERHYTIALTRAYAARGGDTAAILTNLARTALETGRYGDAKRFVTQALSPDADQNLRTRIVEARVAMMTGEHARAESLLRDVSSKATIAATRWWARGYLAQLYARTGRNTLAEKAYRDAIETVRTARETIKDSELRLSFYNVSAEVFRSYVDFLVQIKRFDDALAATELIRAQSLEEQLGGVPAARKLDPRAIAKEQNATILSYWLDRERSHLWTITPAAVTYAALPPEQVINAEVTAYRADLLGPRGTLEVSGVRGQKLWSMLVAPARIANGARVIVIADGPLHTLNLETLVAPTPAPRYWIEDAIISSASSLQLLARGTEKKEAAASMLLVGNPRAADPAFPPLQNADEEIEKVARHFSSPVRLTDANATPAAYRNAAPGRFAFVHFVAHGTASRKRPLDSAVILGRDASQQYKLVARDIASQPLHARLVTVSSCHGAGERTFAGEGLVGLAWAFLSAGAGQVIAALWQVNDDATPELMDRMYAGIRAGRDPAVALREAKLALVHSKSAYRMPRYWAPFVLYSGG